MTNLERWIFYLRDLPSPEHFIRWNYFFMVSSCLQRRVFWGQEGEFQLFPNLFLIFIGPPACGKSLPATKATEILQSLKLTKVDPEGNLIEEQLVTTAPDSTTLEQLYVVCAEALKTKKICDNPPKFIAHSSVSVCLGDEMGLLFREKTNDLVMFLTYGWDSRPMFRRETRHNGKVEIVNMCLNFLGCCTPDWMANSINKELIEQGFTSRVIFLFADAPRPSPTKIKVTPEQQKAKKEITEHLKIISQLYGEVTCPEHGEAWKWFENWDQKQKHIHVNKDKRLADYYGRKKAHLIKLAIVVHFCEKTTMELDKEDFETALKYLELAEIDMHRALLSAGRNPLYVIANKVLNFLSKFPRGRTHNETLLAVFDDSDNEQLTMVFTYLTNTGQVRTGMRDEDKQTVYIAVKQEKEVVV
jgi:adenylate kinase family enzyme